MKAVGKDAGRAAGVPERDLRDSDGKVQEEDAYKHGRNRRVAILTSSGFAARAAFVRQAPGFVFGDSGGSVGSSMVATHSRAFANGADQGNGVTPGAAEHRRPEPGRDLVFSVSPPLFCVMPLSSYPRYPV